MSKSVSAIVTIVVLLSILICIVTITLFGVSSDNKVTINGTGLTPLDNFISTTIGTQEIEVFESDVSFVVDVASENYADGYLIFTAKSSYIDDNPLNHVLSSISHYQPYYAFVFYSRLVGDFEYIESNYIIQPPFVIEYLNNQPIIIRDSSFISCSIIPNSLTIGGGLNGVIDSEYYKPSRLIARHFVDNGDFDLFTPINLESDFYGTVRVDRYSSDDGATIKITDVEPYILSIDFNFRNYFIGSLQNLHTNLKYLEFPYLSLDESDNIIDFFVSLFEYGEDCVMFIFNLVSSFFTSFYPIYSLR